MYLSNNKILITGGSSGIGLELAIQLLKRNNNVLICGRNLQRLQAAKQQNPRLEIFQCDLAIPEDCDRLVYWIQENHSDLNVLINNAAIVHTSSFLEDQFALEKAQLEFQVNFLAPLRLIKKLASTLHQHITPTIINITTGLVYAPRADYSYYNATKAALHSFTQVLRIQLKKRNFRIIEVLMPAVNTPWHKGNPPKIAISTEKAVAMMLKEVSAGKTEIKVGKVKLLHFISRISPGFALKKINSLHKA
ncbi:MAG: SDR family NAD(P)-dependent oxidoreductase [Flavobacteriaceae bacterium]|nr:SDR family NAD(P)-dependent oxidoreductase [Flavobacteriaceae bacterium]